MSLIFRSGRVEDVPAFARLGHHSFPAVGLSLPDWEAFLKHDPRGGPEILWVGEQNGHVVAGCRLFQFHQWISGVRMPMMGLGTVAISPMERRRGHAARLVTSALRYARDRGDTVSALFPFRTSFYRKLGYALAGEAHQYQLPPRSFPDHPARGRVELADAPASRAEIASVYDRWAPHQTGQLARPHSGWEAVWQEGSRHGAIYRDEKDEPGGYVVFRYLTDTPRGGRGVDIEEAAWLTPEARLGLYGWMASLGDQWDHVLYRAHPDEGFAEFLTEHRHPSEGTPRWHFWFPSAVVMAGPMFRILNIERAWRARRVRVDKTLRVGLAVDDSQISENSGDWTLTLEQGRAEVIRGTVPSVRLRMTLTIEALSKIFIGSMTPSMAMRTGRAQVTDSSDLHRLDAALALPRPWTFDRF